MAGQELKNLIKPQNLRQNSDEDSSLRDILEYLQEVSGRLDSLETVEDFQVLIENVLNELDGKEILVLSRNQTSRCFEKFVPFLSHQNLVKIFAKLDDKEVFWKLSTNPYGSRVYQSFLRRIQNDEIQGGELFTQLEQHGFWLAEDICDYVTERNASYVFRDCLSFACGGMLSGKESQDKKYNKGIGMWQRLKKTKFKQEDPENKCVARIPTAVNKISEAFVQLEPTSVWDLVGDRYASLCVQSILSAIQKDTSKVQKIVSLIIPQKVEDIHQAMTHYITCHTLEFALKHAPLNISKQLFENGLKGKIQEYALHQHATFVIQTFISSIESRDVLLQILDELSGEKLAKIFDADKGGVLLCLVEKARQMGCSGVLQLVLDMVNLWADQEGSSKALAPLLITRNTGITLGDDIEEENNKSLSYIGTTLLSYLLRFDESNQQILRPFVQSLSDLAKDKVIKISKDKFGSRLFEAFFKSKIVDDIQKRKVCKKYKLSFAELCLSAPGSFIVETIFRWAEMKFKLEIMNELKDKINQIDQDRYGLKVSQNLDLQGFYQDKKAWEARIKFKQSMKMEFEQEYGNKNQHNKQQTSIDEYDYKNINNNNQTEQMEEELNENQSQQNDLQSEKIYQKKKRKLSEVNENQQEDNAQISTKKLKKKRKNTSKDELNNQKDRNQEDFGKKQKKDRSKSSTLELDVQENQDIATDKRSSKKLKKQKDQSQQQVDEITNKLQNKQSKKLKQSKKKKDKVVESQKYQDGKRIVQQFMGIS